MLMRLILEVELFDEERLNRFDEYLCVWKNEG